MSIAENEAARKYPVPTDDDDPMSKYFEPIAGYPSAKRQGYITGRTAEPTEEEIEAAARRLYEITHALKTDPGWHETDEDRRETCRRLVVAILDAARKAVTE